MHSDDQLNRAYANVTCLQVARHFGIKLKSGIQKSPFREDKNGQSFSVCHGDRFFTEFTESDKAHGIWEFAKRCELHNGIQLTGRERRDLLVELNGETPEKLTPGLVKKQVAVKRKVLYREAAATAQTLPTIAQGEQPGPMSLAVRERWENGLDPLVTKSKIQGMTRGWDEHVILDLIDLNKTSAPILPWGRGRGWAWMVEKPIYRNGIISLVAVGYHERYTIHHALEPNERRWVYVPYIPQKVSSDFQMHLQIMGVKLPAYPFVLGDLSSVPKLVVILEGQFDAVSFAEAFGWLKNGVPPGVVVFGLRGVHSHVALLAGYGLWLRKYAPFVWIIGDNDKAGRKIDDRKNLNAIAAEPTFVDRLRAQGCTVRAELIGHPNCKDFNDVYRAARPSIGTMRAWAQSVGANVLTL